MTEKASIRNMLRFEEEDEEWREVLNQFPNKVPRFNTKAEALLFTQQHCTKKSNPTYSLYHSITTLIDWNQVSTLLIPKILEYHEKWPIVRVSSEDVEKNVFMKKRDSGGATFEREDEQFLSQYNEQDISSYLESRLNLSIHRELSLESTFNTLKYMFFHMKCGILVMIRNNQVVLFSPFVNKDYRNSWRGRLQVDSGDGSLEQYYEKKREHYREERYLKDQDEWWANGNIICNEYQKEHGGIQYWGDQFLFQLKDMFSELCRCRVVPDCEFFINKRDYPHLKVNESIGGGIPVEPYGFIFDRDDKDKNQDIPLNRHFYKSYAPILSFYSSSRFADIPIPPSEDWEAATGLVFPASFIHNYSKEDKLEVGNPRDLFTADNLRKFETPWEKKIPVAFFRGTATGGGVTPETNQRLNLAQTSFEWEKDPLLNGQDPDSNQGHPFLDAKITGWNLRDKKIASRKMTHLRPNEFDFEGSRQKNFVEIYKQGTFKYLIYAEGHCAACRYGFMMQLGSVILKVDSLCVADSMWYFPLLKPFVDHIPIKSDLSDLREKLDWCHSHDAECRQIARQAQLLYSKFIHREGVLDYLQSVCVGISTRSRRVLGGNFQQTKENFPAAKPIPKLPPAFIDENHFCTQGQDGRFLCSYCQLALENDKVFAEQKKIRSAAAEAEAKEREKQAELEKKKRNKMLRQRMKQQAKPEKGTDEKASTEQSAEEKRADPDETLQKLKRQKKS